MMPSTRDTPEQLPRWRGFNLLEKFTHTPDEWKNIAQEWGYHNEPFRRSDFELIAELGFNFARLPMSYLCWSDESDWESIDEKVMEEIDQAISWGKEFGIHVCINFHRAPGYTVNHVGRTEKLSLWNDPEAVQAFIYHWEFFTKRYLGRPASELSFNLINEPSGVNPEIHDQLIRSAVSAIRTLDPERPVIIDCIKSGNNFLTTQGLRGMNLVHSGRGYDPAGFTHFQAPWATAPPAGSPSPENESDAFSKAYLQGKYKALRELENTGEKIMIGEFGCYNQTPHTLVLKWMEENLKIWKEYNWGWALWCLRGSFGIANSGRKDVLYEKSGGYLIDRKMVNLLQKYS